MSRRPASGTKGLYKKHSRGCVNQGGKPTACPCPWWGAYKYAKLSLAAWAGRDLDPSRKGPAEAVLTRLKAAVDANTFRREGEHASVALDETLSAFITVYKRDHVERHNLSKASLYPTLDVIAAGLGHYPLKVLVGEAGTPLIERWLNDQQDQRGWRAATWNHYHQELGALFNKARKWRHVRASNPMDFIDRLVVHRDAPNSRRIEEDTEQALFDACPALDQVHVRRNRSTLGWDAVHDIRRRAATGEHQTAIAADHGVSPATVNDVIHFRTWNEADARHSTKGAEMRRRLTAGFDLGLRRSEMLDVQLSMIDFTPAVCRFDGQEFEVYTLKMPSVMTKGGKRTGAPEYVYAGTTRIKAVLEERRAALKDNPPHRQYLFGRDDGSHEASFDRSAKRLFGLAGVKWGRYEGRVWHTVRHEFVSRTLENSGSPRVAQAMARHKDGRTTQGYLHARESGVLEAAVRLDQTRRAGASAAVASPGPDVTL